MIEQQLTYQPLLLKYSDPIIDYSTSSSDQWEKGGQSINGQGDVQGEFQGAKNFDLSLGGLKVFW